MPTKRFSLSSNVWTQVTSGAGVVDVVEGCSHVLVHVNTVSPPIETNDFHTLRWGGKDTFPYGQSENIYLRAYGNDTYAIVTSENVL